MMQAPGAIIVEVFKQPPITPELGMADVVLGAVSLTGAIMAGALGTGLTIGIVVVVIKMIRARRPDAMDR
jgi:hypothetical protein